MSEENMEEFSRLSGADSTIKANEQSCASANLDGEAASDVMAYGAGFYMVQGPRWYVVHAQSRGEMHAVANLKRQAFQVFCPMIACTIRHARKVTRTRAPLFPGYLFVSLDLSRDRWRSINGTIGVVRILTDGERPIPVPCGVVENIRARSGNDGVVERSTPFVCGQTVKMCDGPFIDFVGRIEHIAGPERVQLLLELMGRAVTVQTDVRMLVSAE